MSPIDIYVTSWNRIDFTLKAIRFIRERTSPDTYLIHLFDNGSDRDTQDRLYEEFKKGRIASLHMDSRNTGCLYNKGIFHMMTEATSKYYCISDNDVFPPKLSPDWLSQMIAIMERHPDIALLAPQLPPQFLQMPDRGHFDDEVMYCKAVGNTLKIVRRQAFPLAEFKPLLGKYGDDGLVSEMVEKKGFKSAFCRKIFCYHAGQCENWGYKPDEIALDPRKQGYGKPFIYPILSEDTWEPPLEMRM